MSDSLSRQELDLLLTEQLVRVDPQALGIYELYRAAPELVVREYPHSSMRGVSDQVYVIARTGRQVLFYDDVEEEFGTAELDLDGVMRDWGTWGKELLWALRQFPPADRADGDGIDADVLEAEIMSMATEDMHGLHEIIWTLNVSHNAVPKEAKIAAAQSAISSLAARGLIALHRLEWHPERDLGRIPQATISSVLADPPSWEAGKEYVGFVATTEGRESYRLGHFPAQ